MKISNRVLFILILFWGSSLFSSTVSAQIFSGNCFIKGQFIEVGIGPCGTFGSSVNAPPGFHTRGGSSNPQRLGFVADYGKDGWNVGSPNYCGDYYVPGEPEEGWCISMNGLNYNNNLLCSLSEISGAITQYSNNGSSIIGTWQGGISGLQITSKTIVPIDKLYFLTEVTLKNTTTDTIRDFYYMRNIDPDNEQTLTSDFTTINTIVSQNPNIDNKAVVTAEGLVYGCFIALGTRDCRAKVTFGGFTNRNAKNAWNCLGDHICSGTQTDDKAISIAFKLGNLAPGRQTSLKFVNVLNITDLDEAVNLTGPSFLIGDIDEINSGDTALICSSGPTVFEVVNTGGFDNWSWSPATGLNTTTGPVVICDGSVNNQLYTATGLNSCGGTINIHFVAKKGVINQVPKAGPISGPRNFCLPNTTATFSIAPIFNAKTYRWHMPAGSSILSGDGTTSVTVNLGSAIMYDSIWVCGVNVCGPGDTSMIRVQVCDCNTIYPITPVLTNICPGDSVRLTTNAITGAIYQWFKNGVIMPGLTSNSIFATDQGTYTAIIHPNSFCVNNTAAATVNFTSPPVVNLTPSGKVYKCLATGVLLTANVIANAPGSVRYDWYKDNVLVLADGASTYNATTDGFYYVKVTNANLCKSSSNIDTVISRQPPVLLRYGFIGDASTCSGKASKLNATYFSQDGTIASWQWYSNGVAIPGATDSFLVVNSTGNYSVKFTTVYGCSNSLRDTGLIFYITPVAGFKVDGCVQGDLTFTDTSSISSGSITEWSWKKDGIVFSTIQNPVVDFPGGTYLLQLIVKSDKGCYSDPSIQTFLRYGQPRANFEVDGLCSDSLTQLNAISITPGYGNSLIGDWNWDLGNGLLSSLQNPSLIYDSAGSYTISLSYHGNNCPVIKNSISKTVYFGDPLAPMKYNNIAAIENEPFMLYGEGDGVDYRWDPILGLNSPLSRISRGALGQSQLYKLHVINQYGCERVDSVMVNIITACKILVPNVFTPNKDGLNEIFRAYFGCLQQLNHFSIYNRLGQMVFNTEISTQGWDGKVNGKDQDIGTYIWVAEGIYKGGRKFNEKGSFILIR